jgi:hypothetical protein
MLCDCGWAIVVCKKRGEDECEMVTMTKEGGEGGGCLWDWLTAFNFSSIEYPENRNTCLAFQSSSSGSASCTQRCSIENWQLLRAHNLLIPQEAGGKAA